LNRSFVAVIAIASSFLAVSCFPDKVKVPSKVVLVIVDDLGWADLSSNGSSFYETPNIDRFASSSAMFRQFYAASPVCSPTRSSLMTGFHPARIGITNWIGGTQNGALLQAKNENHLPRQYKTIGEILKEEGFLTAFFGKWHLGRDDHMPSHRGFDSTFAVNRAGQPASYYFPFGRETDHPSNVPDLGKANSDSYLTDLIGDRAAAFIESNRDRSFLSVISFYSVHTPIQGKAELVDIFAEKADSMFASSQSPFVEDKYSRTKLRQDNPSYAAMVNSVDQNFGKIIEALKLSGQYDETLILFTSDNGGLSTLTKNRNLAPTSNTPLRSGKGWMYEGGIRMPLIISSPTIVDGVVVDVPASSEDLVPSILDLLEISNFDGFDGWSLEPLLKNERIPDRDLHWHFPHYHGSGNRPSGAIRSGPYKLLEWFEDDRTELYNIEDDISESMDLATDLPSLKDSLKIKLNQWRSKVGARMPTPNPNWKEESQL